ncbi:hypothetical protein CRUP_003586, partial [Coryphaenoides rupestris]
MKHFLRVLTQFFVFLYCKCLWRGLKFVARKLTGRCELQRICYNNKHGARRTLKIESSLKYSKNELLRAALSVHPDKVEKTIDGIMALKKINPDTNPQLGISLQSSLLQVVGYRSLVGEVEKLRREPYDCENAHHEALLMQLWKELRPDTPLSGRISKQWYFAEHDKATALQVLHDSLQPKHSELSPSEWEQKSLDKAISFSFAIVGINITDLAYSLLVSGALKTHLYNEFHGFWVEEDPGDIMEFNRVRSKFHRRVLRQLKNPDAALCPHFSASDLHLVN